MEEKLEEVKAGRAIEYLNPLAELEEDMRIRTQVAGKDILYFECDTSALSFFEQIVPTVSNE